MFCIIGFVIDYGVLSYVHAKVGFLFYDVCLVMNEKNGIFFLKVASLVIFWLIVCVLTCIIEYFVICL